MEEDTSVPINKLIQSQIPQSSKSPDEELPTLTPEETIAVIKAAREAKANTLARAAYAARVREEYVPRHYEPSELGDRVLRAFELSKGRSFVVDKENKQVFEDLCRYFTGNPGNLDLNRGIMVWGNPGVGKTELMKLFTTNPYASYAYIVARQVANNFSFCSEKENPEDEIRRLSHLKKAAKPHPFGHEQLGMLFDDVGTETIPAVNYGNHKNVIAEVLLNRYDNGLPYQGTHVVTNLTAEKIQELYGTRVYDRMKQMFNHIIFPQTTSRRS